MLPDEKTFVFVFVLVQWFKRMYTHMSKAGCKAVRAGSRAARRTSLKMSKPVPYISRRSPVLGLNGCVSTDQPLATAAALDILRKGGNAVDAAIAGAAVLQVIQPYATGIGGDCFCLFYNASQKRVQCINGSGKSPSKLTLDLVNKMGYNESHPLDDATALSATVPGAAKGWYDSLHYFGSKKLSMKEILEPAIGYAEQGFPVGPMNSFQWSTYRSKLLSMHGGKAFLVNGSETPTVGMLVRNVPLANVLKRLAHEGPSAIYRGEVAQSIVDAAAGGVLSLDDLEDHLRSNESPRVLPTSTTYRGLTVHTTPPPSHGVIFLEALNILEGFDLKKYDATSAEYLHLMIEALRLSFADGLKYVADPTSGRDFQDKMISKEHASGKRALVHLDRVTEIDAAVSAPEQSHTTFLVTSDAQGNACAFINSNFKGFGCSIVERHGFALHCRGLGFNLIPGHPNSVGPRKRPYHTLMPVILTDSATGQLMAAMGTMGGYGQPQQNLRVLLNMLEMKMNPQEAVDMPRFLIGTGTTIHPNDPLLVEEGTSDDVINFLMKRGHKVQREVVSGSARRDFGHCHVITKGNWWCRNDQPSEDDASVYWAGCDPRSDGVAAAF